MQQEEAVRRRTLCEINCQLVSASTGSRFDRLGVCCPDVFLSRSDRDGEDVTGRRPSALLQQGTLSTQRQQCSEKGNESIVHRMAQQLLTSLPGVQSLLPRPVHLHLSPSATPLAWHLRKPLLAAVYGSDKVFVYDFSGQVPSLGQPPLGSHPPSPLAPSQTLSHEMQQGVTALAWRPNSGSCLAAACTEGVCLWRLSGGGSTGRTGGAWMTLLRPPSGAGAPLCCLSWHPQGHLLAGGFGSGAGMCVWDVATGACTPLRAGSEAVNLLSWSPCGSYLLSGHPSGNFRVWQTLSWWSIKWSAAEGGAAAGAGGLAGVNWSPDSRTLLLGYASAPHHLLSLHFTADPPSLQAQLLPVLLPEIAAGTAANGARGAAAIDSMVWDSRGQRLAVALGGSHPEAGSVALYDTRCDPILSARFVGFIRLGPLSPTVGRDQEGGQAGGGLEGREAEAGAAPGEGRQDEEGRGVFAGNLTRQAFWCGFNQGALLAVRRGECVATIPLYFSS